MSALPPKTDICGATAGVRFGPIADMRCSCILLRLGTLLWLMSLNPRQQFFFQQSSALPEPLNLHLETIEELNDLAVLVTKRVEACVCRH
jgi:hypothetical protein